MALDFFFQRGGLVKKAAVSGVTAIHPEEPNPVLFYSSNPIETILFCFTE